MGGEVVGVVLLLLRVIHKRIELIFRCDKAYQRLHLFLHRTRIQLMLSVGLSLDFEELAELLVLFLFLLFSENLEFLVNGFCVESGVDGFWL